MEVRNKSIFMLMKSVQLPISEISIPPSCGPQVQVVMQSESTFCTSNFFVFKHCLVLNLPQS